MNQSGKKVNTFIDSLLSGRSRLFSVALPDCELSVMMAMMAAYMAIKKIQPSMKANFTRDSCPTAHEQ